MGEVRDYTIEQNWAGYGADEHAVWRLLFKRQPRLLPGERDASGRTGKKEGPRVSTTRV